MDKETREKVFISQSMKGKTKAQCEKERASVVKELEELSYEVVDSFIENETPLVCLAKSLEILAKCDCAYFMDGWKTGRGCAIEHDCCIAYGIRILKD